MFSSIRYEVLFTIKSRKQSRVPSFRGFILRTRSNLTSPSPVLFTYLTLSSLVSIVLFTDEQPSASTGKRERLYTSQLVCRMRHEGSDLGQYKTRTADYGLRTTDYGLGIKHGLRYKTRTKHYGLSIKYGLGIKHGLG